MNHNYNRNGQQAQDDDSQDEKKYEAYMRAGELSVGEEAEASEEASQLVQRLWEKGVEDVQSLNDDERRSVGLK